MSRVAIPYCVRAKGQPCIACAKRHKGMSEKNREFARHDKIGLVP